MLDEIGDMNVDMQAKLLRVLESRTLKRVGGEKEIPVDVRVVSATNRNLIGAIGEGKFREDLYYRINSFTIEIPPLRERPMDVALLAEHFLVTCAGEMRKDVSGFTDGALDTLGNHGWPGNVRELRNTIERAVIVCSGNSIRREDLEFVPSIQSRSVATGTSGTDQEIEAGSTRVPEDVEDLKLDTLERAAIEEAIRRSGGNRGRAADLLGLSRYALRRRM